MPDEFFSAMPVKRNTGTGTTSHDYSSRNHVSGNQDWQKKQEEEKKEKERQEKLRNTPMMIGRKGNKPPLKDLNLIKKMVEQIKAGDYKTELPDPDEKKNKKTSG
jgi:hypothetical protein